MPQRKSQSYEHTVITKGDTRYDPPSLDTLNNQPSMENIMITIKLNPNERDWLRQLAQDNLPYAYGDDADCIAGILTVLNPYSPWLRGYTLTAAQWHELLEFVSDEDVTTFTAGVTDAINAALHCTQYSPSGAWNETLQGQP